MSLEPGVRLGPYEVIAPLGAGGMGEVYKARDTRLDRIVAIKVLPAHVASDPNFRDRFEREAKVISQLDHPHICALYDVGEAPNPESRPTPDSRFPTPDKIQFLVMQYLEGETLADRLRKGALPLDQAVSFAIQIADALDKAHRQGIVHRDLKPGNIMLTKAGAKLLDFGLAKTGGPVGAGAALSMLPTTPPHLTAQGTILGTFQYMAPEQLEGKEADARTDIFAFGAMLYEMLTGKKAFEGKTQASLIHAIMGLDPPPISTVQPVVPESINRIVKTCLAKDPDDRWQSARDVLRELKWVAESASQPAVSASGTHAEAAAVAPARARLGTWERTGWIVLAIVLAGIAVGVSAINYFRTPAQDASPVQFEVPRPEKTSFYGVGAYGSIPSPSISEDGRRLAFVAVGDNGTASLWVRTLDSSNPQALPGTEGASYAFWSPDGRFIGFFTGGELKKTDTSGGVPQTLCEVGGGFRGGGAWSRDDVILFAPTYTSSLYRVPATGGVPVPVTTLDASQQETAHLWPSFLPDGRHFLYLVRSAKPDHAGIFVGSIDSNETRRLIRADSPAVYAPQGYLVFLVGTDLMAQPFNADRLELTGVPVRIAEQVFYNSFIGGYAAFSVSRNTLVYRTGYTSGTQLVWFDRTGKQLERIGTQTNYTIPSLSPDERQVATGVISDTGTNDIWMLDLVRNTSSRLTFDGTSGIPIWSPDGSRILYRSGQTGPGDLYQRLSSGAGAEEALLKSNAVKNPTDWSSDGRFVIYENQFDPKTGIDVWVLPTTGDRPSTGSASSGSTVSGVEPSTSSGRPEPAEGRKPFPFLQTPFNEQQGRLSPDGRWIAYTSEETGNPEVYVQSFPQPGGKWQISTSGGADPRWRRDGKELFFISNDRKLMAVEVKGADSTFQADLPQELFATRVSGLTDVRTHYAVTADGKRFLVSSLGEDDGSSPMTVVLNWAAGLKK